MRFQRICSEDAAPVPWTATPRWTPGCRRAWRCWGNSRPTPSPATSNQIKWNKTKPTTKVLRYWINNETKLNPQGNYYDIESNIINETKLNTMSESTLSISGLGGFSDNNFSDGKFSDTIFPSYNFPTNKFSETTFSDNQNYFSIQRTNRNIAV